MEWLTSILASKSAQAGIAGAAGGASSALVKRLTIKNVILYVAVGAMSGIYVGPSMADHLGIMDHWHEVSYVTGIISFAVITAMGQINWIKFIKNLKINISN